MEHYFLVSFNYNQERCFEELSAIIKQHGIDVETILPNENYDGYCLLWGDDKSISEIVKIGQRWISPIGRITPEEAEKIKGRDNIVVVSENIPTYGGGQMVRVVKGRFSGYVGEIVTDRNVPFYQEREMERVRQRVHDLLLAGSAYPRANAGKIISTFDYDRNFLDFQLTIEYTINHDTARTIHRCPPPVYG